MHLQMQVIQSLLCSGLTNRDLCFLCNEIPGGKLLLALVPYFSGSEILSAFPLRLQDSCLTPALQATFRNPHPAWG